MGAHQIDARELIVWHRRLTEQVCSGVRHGQRLRKSTEQIEDICVIAIGVATHGVNEIRGIFGDRKVVRNVDRQLCDRDRLKRDLALFLPRVFQQLPDDSDRALAIAHDLGAPPSRGGSE